MSSKKEPSPIVFTTDSLNLEQRLAKCRAAVSYVVKEAKKVNGQYFPVTYNEVAARCKPELEQHGVGLWFDVVAAEVRPQTKINDNGVQFVGGYFCDITVNVHAINVDCPSDAMAFRVFVTAWDTLDKAANKAYTVARKQAYIALFQLETYEENEVGEGRSAPAPVAPEKYTAIDASQIAVLKQLAAEIKIEEAIVAKAADATYERIEQIPVAKFEEIRLRLTKRAEQIRSAAK